MNIKETIRAEIERRLSNIVTGLDFTAEIELKGLLSFLNTLPEQPVEGLEEEIGRYWNRATGFQPSFAVLELTKDDLAKVARHFAEWGASHAKTPTP